MSTISDLVPAPAAPEVLREALMAQPLHLSSKTLLHHIYPSEFTADSFNPGLGCGRFHPFLDVHGVAVPVYYVADSEEGSYCETLLRALGETQTQSCLRLPERRLERHSYAQLRVNSPLQLAHLCGNQLHRLGLTRAGLLEPGAAHYQQTAAWAQAIHAACPTLHGLAWVSRQHDASTCMMLFGDRVAVTQLQVLDSMPLASTTGRARGAQMATRLGVVLTL